MPSSTTTTVRPARSTRGQTARTPASFCSSSARSRWMLTLEGFRIDAGGKLLIDPQDVALAHRADGELGVPRRSHLLDTQHIELGAEANGNHVGHDHAATRYAENHGRRAVADGAGELLGKLGAGVPSIKEWLHQPNKAWAPATDNGRRVILPARAGLGESEMSLIEARSDA